MPTRFLNNININDSYTLPPTDGTADQVISTDGAGQLSFIDQTALSAESAEVVKVPVKNLQGSALTKGDPVYISGSVGTSGRLEVKLADAADTTKMPALGLLAQDLAINGEGYAVVTGKLKNLVTSPIDGVTPSEGDVVYVKSGGTTGAALTTTKPIGVNLIQNMGKVGRVSTANDGTFVVSSILRSNDVPTPIYIDHALQRVGIGDTTPGEKLTVNGGNLEITNASPEIIFNQTGTGQKTTTITAANGTSQAPPAGDITWRSGRIVSQQPPDGLSLSVYNLTASFATNRIFLPSTTFDNFVITLDNTSVLEIDPVTEDVGINQYIYHLGDTDTKFGFVANDNFAITTGSTERVRVTSGGSVGIGTNNPSKKLDVNGTIRTNSDVLIDATLPTLTFVDPNGSGQIFESAGSMLFRTGLGATPPIVMQLKADGALQHGNSSATGQYAAAFGQNNTASSLDAFATGENNTSSGRQSFTAGFDNIASGNASFAVGGGTIASAENSFAANGTTIAMGISSAAFGAFSKATNTNAFAINGDTTASGESSFSAGVSTQAQGLASIATGQSCTTAGSANGAFAGGTVSNATSQFSIAYGDVANASGRVSQALGYIVNATGQYSFAQGFNNTASGTAAAAFGQQNTSSGTASWSLTTGFLNTTRDSASLTVGSHNGMTASTVPSREQFMLGRYLNVPRDSSGNPSAGCLVVGEHNAYSNRPNVKFAVGTGAGVGAEADSFTVLKDGNVLMEQVVNKNYSSDSAAASGGVPIGGIYHNSGDLKIRLT